MSGLISASCSSMASRLPLVLTGAGRVALYSLMQAFIADAVKFLSSPTIRLNSSGNSRYAMPIASLSPPSGTGAGRVALCASNCVLISSALNSGGSPALYSSINARIVAVVVKAPSGISGSMLNSFSSCSGCSASACTRLPISRTGERTFWMVLDTWRASKYISDTRASLTIVELMPLAAW